MRTMRIVLLSVLLGAVAGSALAESRVISIDIGAQPLGDALAELGRQANLAMVFYDSDVVRDVKSAPLLGKFTAEDALGRLLLNTGLEFEYLDGRTVAIRVLKATARPGDRMSAGELDNSRLAQSESSSSIQGENDQGNRQVSEDDSKRIQEIVVTAQKRVERLQDVPVPVTAISAQALVDSNQTRIQDYYTKIPGLSVTPDDYGNPKLTIRGVTTGGYTNPTVGVTIDDVPYGTSSRSAAAPDIDPSELARIEVLRGPQGTLYGASSIGGLLKFVTVDPSTDGVSGRVQGGVSSIYNGDELGYNVRGTMNVPLGDTWAVRAGGFTRREPGYIDNPELGIEGVNRRETNGGRLSTLWRPSESISLKVSAMLQDIDADGASNVNVRPGLGDLQQSVLVRGIGGYSKKTQAYSATLAAKLGKTDLTLLSGYNIDELSDSVDYTPLYGPLADNGVPGTGFNGFGVTGAPLFEHAKTSKFTQEMRLSTPIGEKTEWVFGAFYTREDSPFTNDFLAAVPATGAIAGSLLHTENSNTYSEYAAFANVTLQVTDRFDIQLGGRESRNRQYSSSTVSGPIVPIFFQLPSPSTSATRTKDSSFTYLVTPRFRVSPDLMMYARLASGYRVGGPNLNLTIPVPAHFDPDRTKNYEIGIKGEAFEHAVSFDASLYYIDWKDIQIQLLEPVARSGYIANGGRARSQGMEFSAETRPSTGLTIAAWIAWNDAELTEDFPVTASAFGFSGDRLPHSSRFSGSLSLDQEFPLANGLSGFAGSSASYVGSRSGNFTSVFTPLATRSIYPSYVKIDLRAGISWTSWKASAFVNNLADKRGVLVEGLGGTLFPDAFSYIQPRTVGLSVSKEF